MCSKLFGKVEATNEDLHDLEITAIKESHLVQIPIVCFIKRGLHTGVHAYKPKFTGDKYWGYPGGRLHITFHKLDAPDSYNIGNIPVYIVNAFCVLNVYHNIEDFLLPLYYMLEQTGRLYSEVTLYHSGDGCRLPGPVRVLTEPLLKEIFHIKGQILSIQATPRNVCYKNVATTTRIHYKHLEEHLNFWVPIRKRMSKFVLERLGLLEANDCPQNKITIIQRDDERKILNIDELVSLIQQYKLANVTVVEFRSMTFRDQIKIAYCTDVSVGPCGAGLVWGTFMKENKAVIEIAWPNQGWPFFYSQYYDTTKHCRVYKMNISEDDLIGKPPPQTEKHSDNPRGQYSDVIVNPNVFLQLLTYELDKQVGAGK